MRDKILIDTCVVLDDPAVIRRIRERNGIPFLTGTVLDELNGKKNGTSDIARSAREVFRLVGTSGTPLDELPDGGSVRADDSLVQFGTPTEPIFVLTRRNFDRRVSNDDRIMEIADSYRMILLSRDQAMVARAQAVGIKAEFWRGPKAARKVAPIGQRPDGLVPFRIGRSPVPEDKSPYRKHAAPKAGDIVSDANGRQILLSDRVGGGGEGTIYDTSLIGHVAKIYSTDRLTPAKKAKVELMLTRAVRFPGLCWPVSTLMDGNGEFVGYLMPKAAGKTLQSAVFVKPVLEKTFPGWKRLDLVSLAIAFVDQMQFLHGLNVIVGDINPNNVLVTSRSDRIGLVDTDSFQIEDFPCPVGTVNFTPPERQGMDYSAFLRTKEDDLFAVATMIFMILHPGKPPYSQQGGGTPGENIRSRNFPYRFRKAGEEFTGRDAPKGPWQSIWANLPWPLRSAFHRVFREGGQVTLSSWSRLLRSYYKEIFEGRQNGELFPESYPIRDPVRATCAKCGCSYIASERNLMKLRQERKDPWCSSCHREVELARLANQSARDRRMQQSRPTPPPPAAYAVPPPPAPTYPAPRPSAPRYTAQQPPPPKRSVKPQPAPPSTGCVIVGLLFAGSIVTGLLY